MKNLPAFVAVGALGVVLGLLLSVGLANGLGTSAQDAAEKAGNTSTVEQPIEYGAR
ncbi:hypothetical protein GA0070616_2310 [Micromonospora nigra]|uniref:DUF2613 domain-containing protein n=1 Tax=Micromonospora nigra TaxID=145857 RepID=A0A1C6RW83_9ACTN|nr:hypothetical protein [Micromonospora nigra]SCL21473.1 hypothetical protein GA0070616_2310 [Micromonospora nigra]